MKLSGCFAIFIYPPLVVNFVIISLSWCWNIGEACFAFRILKFFSLLCDLLRRFIPFSTVILIDWAPHEQCQTLRCFILASFSWELVHFYRIDYPTPTWAFFHSFWTSDCWALIIISVRPGCFSQLRPICVEISSMPGNFSATPCIGSLPCLIRQ